MKKILIVDKEKLFDAIQKHLNNVKLTHIYTNDEEKMPLVDFLSTGDEISSGKEEIEMIVDDMACTLDCFTELTPPNATKPQHDAKLPVSGSLPLDDRILTEAIQAARKFDTEAGLLPSNNDIRMFCLGAKWMIKQLGL